MAGSQDLFAQLWKEYALSDSRYLTSDPFVLSVEAITVVGYMISPEASSWLRCSRLLGDLCAGPLWSALYEGAASATHFRSSCAWLTFTAWPCITRHALSNMSIEVTRIVDRKPFISGSTTLASTCRGRWFQLVSWHLPNALVSIRWPYKSYSCR